MEKAELTQEENMKLNKVVLITTAGLAGLSLLNYIISEILNFKFIPFPDGIIIICGLTLVVRSAWLLKLNITRKYHSKKKTNLLLIALLATCGLLSGYYIQNSDLIIDGNSLNRNVTIAIGAVLLLCGMWIESYIGTKALIKDTGAR